MNEEVNILDYFRIIKSKWKLLASIFVLAEIVTLIVTLLQPRIYESTATILPPEATAEKGVMITSKLPYIFRQELPASLYGGGAASQVIIAMLKSKKMARDIIEEFKLAHPYKSKSILNMIKRLENRTNISMSKEGVISITVSSKDSELAARIANFYVSNLDRMNDELKITSSKPIVTPLDLAIPAEHPSRPNVKLALLIVGVLSIFTGILLSFFVNYIETLKKSSSAGEL